MSPAKTEVKKTKVLVKEAWGYSLWVDQGSKGRVQVGASCGGMFIGIELTADQEKELKRIGECNL